MNRLALSATVLMAAASVTIGAVPRAGDPPAAGQFMMGYVGNVVNGSPTPTSSLQFGNLTSVAGADASMFFTFYTEATTASVVSNGPLRILSRTGTTTIYLASGAGTFDNPESFRSGTAVQVSSLQQQVIVDTTTGLFTVANFNTITRTRELHSLAPDLDLGHPGQILQTTLTGRLNTAGASPTGWFGGYAVR